MMQASDFKNTNNNNEIVSVIAYSLFYSRPNLIVLYN